MAQCSQIKLYISRILIEDLVTGGSGCQDTARHTLAMRLHARQLPISYKRQTGAWKHITRAVIHLANAKSESQAIRKLSRVKAKP